MYRGVRVVYFVICELRFHFLYFAWAFLYVFSVKKNNNNAQGGGQSRTSLPTVNSSSLESSNASTPRGTAVQNGSHVQPQHGMNFSHTV